MKLYLIVSSAPLNSHWSITKRLTTRNPKTNEEINYFLKVFPFQWGVLANRKVDNQCAMGDDGMLMMRGEYESMSTIYSVIPRFCPNPIAWGECKSKQATYFYICEFVEMGQSPPPAEQFCTLVANMHTKGTSSNGKFGFHITTCNGNISQDNSWCDSWEVFFAAGFRHMLNLYNKVNGENKEMSALLKPFFDKVIPRLLGPLEAEGRRIKPALLHGDLWYGNTAIAVEDGVPVVFDACSFYGHNEYELGNWSPARNKLEDYIGKYVKIMGMSDPVEDFNYRIILYSMFVPSGKSRKGIRLII
ncbi:Fructosamine kinase-domain-containing protein [Trichophaea hybrida]|nr:Fructosamine kinase-domain-containing protein [Trichophaea hybrida]